MHFEAHIVGELLSVAHLFPKSRPRRGLYVLIFDDGERYVGQTVNIVARFADHRARWNDIATLMFARIPSAPLDVPERDLIHFEQRACETSFTL